MNMRTLLVFGFISLTLASCVSSKKYKSSVSKYDSLKTDYNKVEDQLRTCLSDNEANAKKAATLQEQNDYLRENYTSVLNQLKDLSVISTAQAESIKKSLENLNAKDTYIKDLQVKMQQ